MTDVKNVYQRLSDACRIIGTQKWVADLENKQFKSIPIDAMRKGVRLACIQAGLVHVGPYDIECEKVKDERTIRYFGSCKFRYVSIDNPDDYVEYESMGEAMDNGDKGVGKFVTNLIKNHYKACFDIGENGKDDVDSYSNMEYYVRDAEITHAVKTKNSPKQAENPTAKACKKAINDYIDTDPLNPVIQAYAGQYGVISTWSDDIAIECYKAVKDAGHPIQEVKL